MFATVYELRNLALSEFGATNFYIDFSRTFFIFMVRESWMGKYVVVGKS